MKSLVSFHAYANVEIISGTSNCGSEVAKQASIYLSKSCNTGNI